MSVLGSGIRQPRFEHKQCSYATKSRRAVGVGPCTTKTKTRVLAVGSYVLWKNKHPDTHKKKKKKK
jgi:hypothetical protein